jgi:hypothetical protein
LQNYKRITKKEGIAMELIKELKAGSQKNIPLKIYFDNGSGIGQFYRESCKEFEENCFISFREIEK